MQGSQVVKQNMNPYSKAKERMNSPKRPKF